MRDRLGRERDRTNAAGTDRERDFFTERNGVLLQYQNADIIVPEICEDLLIHRLQKPCVHKTDTVLFGDPSRKRKQRSVRDDHGLLQRFDDFPFAEIQSGFHRNIRKRPARIAHHTRFRPGYRHLQHGDKLLLRRRRVHGKIRHCRKERRVEYALMRLSVGADKPRTIQRNHDRKILQTNIVQQRIVSTLQK